MTPSDLLSDPRDGLGRWQIEPDSKHGAVEVRDVAPRLATAAAEQAIDLCARQMTGAPACARILRLERSHAALRIVSEAASGVRLSDLLSLGDAGLVPIPDDIVFELAIAVIRAAGVLHEAGGGLAHGAISPAHVVLRPDGGVLLTDSVFGAAIESLHRNREQLWREFGLALPLTASVSRFDQRSDVTQLGATVLALLLRRPLRADEYPRHVPELVASLGPRFDRRGPAVTRWLQQALQLNVRGSFASAFEAECGFAGIAVIGRRAATQVVRASVESTLSLTQVLA